MKRRALVAVGITFALVLLYVVNGDAPARVIVATTLALVIGFTIPALWIEKPQDIRGRWRRVVPWVLLGALAWDLGSAATIAKVEAFSLGSIPTYVVLPFAFLFLLWIHGLVVRQANRIGGGGDGDFASGGGKGRLKSGS